MKKKIGYMVGVGCTALMTVCASAMPARAQGVLNERQISLALAQEAADAALAQCSSDGFRVSVTVVDRSGQIKAILRGDGTGPHTLDSSRRKAFTSLSFRSSSADFARLVATNPAAANLKDIDGILAVAGGLPIMAGNEVIGGIGVGGAPGGNLDEACAQAGINRISGQLK